MTIRQAFDEFKTIELEWVWVYRCPRCKKNFYHCDEEYCFDGNEKDFEKFLNDYDIYEYDFEITKTDDEKFIYFVDETHLDSFWCAECGIDDFYKETDQEYYKKIWESE